MDVYTLNTSILLSVLTDESGKARQVDRKKFVSIYMNKAFHKTPINVDYTVCSVTGVQCTVSCKISNNPRLTQIT